MPDEQLPPPSPTPPKQTQYPEWDQDCTLELRAFLESRTGRLTLEWLEFWSPVLLDGAHMNKTLVASGEVKNFLATMKQLHSLARENPIPEPPKVHEEYPDLDDDTKWDKTTDTRPEN